MSQRPSSRVRTAAVVAALALSLGAVPATAAPGGSEKAGHEVTSMLSAPAGGHLGSMTSVALAQPLTGLGLSAFGAGPVVVAQAQERADKAAAEAAAKKAAAKKAAAKKAAEKKAAEKRAAEKKAAEKKAAAKRAAERKAASERSSRSSDRESGSPRAIARSMVSARGWGSEQFSCLDKLWNKESNWQTRATNPSSGAYGIPQALPGGKMASAGSDWRTNPATQIRWGLGYIADRYGSPCSAWAHSRANNWY